jgi:hypothetical protein
MGEIVKRYALSEKEREQVIGLLKASEITAADFRDERVVLLHQFSPVIVVPASERGLRHAVNAHVEQGITTPKEATNQLDYPNDFYIIVSPNAIPEVFTEDNPIAYGTDEDWKVIEEALG